MAISNAVFGSLPLASFFSAVVSEACSGVFKLKQLPWGNQSHFRFMFRRPLCVEESVLLPRKPVGFFTTFPRMYLVLFKLRRPSFMDVLFLMFEFLFWVFSTLH